VDENTRHDMLRRARDAQQLVGSLGGAAAIRERALRTMAHFRGIDLKKLRATAEIVQKVWNQNRGEFERTRKALEHLLAPFREAGATLLVVNYGEYSVANLKFEPFLAEVGQNFTLFDQERDPLKATHKAISAKHTNDYLGAFCWTTNRRREMTAMLPALCRAIATSSSLTRKGVYAASAVSIG
jgi:hypothetical protein